MASEDEGKPFSIRLTAEQKAHCLERGRSVNAYIKTLIDFDILRAKNIAEAGSEETIFRRNAELEARDLASACPPGYQDIQVELPIKTAEYLRTLGNGNLSAGMMEMYRLLRADPPPAVDSARAKGLEDLARREAGEVHPLTAAWKQDLPRDPVAFAEQYEGTLPSREQEDRATREVLREWNLPPIYQGGEDVTPRFKNQGRKTGSVSGKMTTPAYDDTAFSELDPFDDGVGQEQGE